MSLYIQIIIGLIIWIAHKLTKLLYCLFLCSFEEPKQKKLQIRIKNHLIWLLTWLQMFSVPCGLPSKWEASTNPTMRAHFSPGLYWSLAHFAHNLPSLPSLSYPKIFCRPVPAKPRDCLFHRQLWWRRSFSSTRVPVSKRNSKSHRWWPRRWQRLYRGFWRSTREWTKQLAQGHLMLVVTADLVKKHKKLCLLMMFWYIINCMLFFLKLWLVTS